MNMVLSDVEESVTVTEVDEETMEEIVQVLLRALLGCTGACLLAGDRIRRAMRVCAARCSLWPRRR